jgi:cytochrome c oxidase subunit 3
MTSPARVLDVSDLPEICPDSRALVWWGNTAMLVIEGTMFALLIASYLYLKTANLDWPPASVQLPPIFWATVNMFVLIVSGILEIFEERAAISENLRAVRIFHALSIINAIVFLAIQTKCVSLLGFKWSDHAYGSIVWTIIGMHTFHMLAATGETAVLLVYESTKPVTKKTYLDMRCTSQYWYFVVLAWIPFYFIIYVAPYFVRKG